jgi:hypothetical protein
VAIQNTGAAPVNLRFDIVNPDGTIAQRSSPAAVNPLPVNGQYSHLVETDMGFTQPINPNSSLAIVVQGSGTFAALPLVIGNGYISSSALTIGDIETTLAFPQVIDGAGYSTIIRLVNPTNAAAKGTLSFYNQDGSTRSANIVGRGTGSQFSVSLAPMATAIVQTAGTAANLTVGLARFDSSIPVGGAATLFLGSAHVGVPPSAPMRSGRIAINTIGGNNTGVAVAAAGSGTVPITLTLQNRDGAGSQSLQPPNANPLPIHGQFANYVTDFAFSSASNVADSSIAVAASGAGMFFPLALLQQGGVFSSTATARQRLFNPQDFAGNYNGTWSTPVFGISGTLQLNSVIDSSGNATITLTMGTGGLLTAPPPIPVSATFTADGQLSSSGPLYLHVQPDGVLTIFALPNSGEFITPTGVIFSYSLSGYVSGKTIQGDLTIVQTDGSVATGSFSVTKP